MEKKQLYLSLIVVLIFVLGEHSLSSSTVSIFPFRSLGWKIDVVSVLASPLSANR